jgi:hypothetical protein
MNGNTYRTIVCSAILGLCWFLCWSAFAQPTNRSDLMAKQSTDIERLRSKVKTLACDMSVEVVVCKGAMNEAAEVRFRKKLETTLPPDDYIVELTKSVLFDFANGRYSANGLDHRVMLELDTRGAPTAVFFREWAATAFDGTHLRSVTPREKLNPKSIPRGIKYPVEFWESKVDETDPTTFDVALAPLFWCGGAISDRAFTTKSMRGPVPLRQWNVKPAAQGDRGKLISLVSPPGQFGEHCELVVPETAFQPVKCVFNNGKRVTSLIEVSYQDTDMGRVPREWIVKELRGDGKLNSQQTYKVKSIRLNPSVNSDSFVLVPTNGMVVESRDGKSLIFAMHGKQLRASTNFALNSLIDQQWHRAGLVLLAIAAFAVIVFVVFRRRLVSFRV